MSCPLLAGVQTPGAGVWTPGDRIKCMFTASWRPAGVWTPEPGGDRLVACFDEVFGSKSYKYDAKSSL